MFDQTNKGKWWDFGWKLIEGCNPVSTACENCWSLSMEKRFRKENSIVIHEERLKRPFKRKKPASYAIWNDLFHEKVSYQFIHETLKVIQSNKQHTFLILTKRIDNALKFFNHLDEVMRNGVCDIDFMPIENLWLGVTAENQEMADKRIPVLLQIPSKVHFISCEPLLSNINLLQSCQIKFINWLKDNKTQYGLDWVICGPETGYKSRPTLKKWIESLYLQCKDANVPFFDKKNILNKNIKQLPNVIQ